MCLFLNINSKCNNLLQLEVLRLKKKLLSWWTLVTGDTVWKVNLVRHRETELGCTCFFFHSVPLLLMQRQDVLQAFQTGQSTVMWWCGIIPVREPGTYLLWVFQAPFVLQKSRWDEDPRVQARLQLHSTTVPVRSTWAGVMTGRIQGVGLGFVGRKTGWRVDRDLVIN